MKPQTNNQASPDRAPGEPDWLIRLENAAFGYGGPPVISGIDLTVGPGDLLGIVGPNGAGKTTLLRGMIGLLKPVEGTVRFGRPSDKRPVLGYVPQVQALDPIFPVTVEEVVAMGAYPRLSRVSLLPASERTILHECLQQVGMADFCKKLFANLSAGQKQRVVIARALMARPDVLLLDEPTSGVDQAAEKAIMNLLGKLNSEGLTVVLICHEMDTMRENVRDVVWISRGKIERGGVEEMLSAAMVKERLGG
jgi:ABC-type Mn2+/Zn2+ transport system ATPase subunit